jgi:UDP-glucose 4-epimerase
VLLGANGFVPSALKSRLKADGIPHLVIGSCDVDLIDPASSAHLATQLKADDVLVMCSALTPEKGRDPATLIKNLRMAEHVALAVSQQRCAHIIYFSSDAVYASGPSPISESTPAAPADLYGVMHLARELILAQAAQTVGIPFCVLRPCAIYGTGDTHNSYGPNRFIRNAVSERKIRIFGDGEEIRDHVFIDDVIALTLGVIERRSAGTLNLVSGQPITFAALALEISRLLKNEVQIETATRTGNSTHRRFDDSAIRQAFPSHLRTTPLVGLTAMLDTRPPVQ